MSKMVRTLSEEAKDIIRNYVEMGIFPVIPVYLVGQHITNWYFHCGVSEGLLNDFEKVKLLARGGQKVVFDAVHKSYGQCVIKLYFHLNDSRSLR